MTLGSRGQGVKFRHSVRLKYTLAITGPYLVPLHGDDGPGRALGYYEVL